MDTRIFVVIEHGDPVPRDCRFYTIDTLRRTGKSSPKMINRISEAVLSRLADRIAPKVADRLVTLCTSELERHFQERLLPDLQSQVQEIINEYACVRRIDAVPVLESRIADLVKHTTEQLEHIPGAIVENIRKELPNWLLQIADDAFVSKMLPNHLTRTNIFVPSRVSIGADGDATNYEYMSASNPTSRDFLHFEYKKFCELSGYPLFFSRKLWEWAYIFYHLNKRNVVKAGARGLGFGTGGEKLPAMFAAAGAHITATDLGSEHGGWSEGTSADKHEKLYYSDVLGRQEFMDRVIYRDCDMNDIPDDLTDYDFLWSSCAFEHLGSLQNGIDFVISSLEKTLKVGGVACHTTEFNLSSETETLEHPQTVIYRKQDLERLCSILEQRGHFVEPLRIVTGEMPLDYYVDVPPYGQNPHLKLLIGGYVTTSVGIIARRGR